ncbi:MAG: NPXTG-anchored protein [Actinomycetota bacterium]
MNKVLKYPVKLGLAITALIGLLAVLAANLTTSASAAATCNASDFTVGGVLNMDGYLACLSGAGGLPSTGSNTFQIVGIALGLVAVGVAAILVAKKRHAASV